MTAATLDLAAGWLGTFALHSTGVLAFAWLLTALLRRRAAGFQERVLRFSLWAALPSATLQCLLLGSPLGFSLPQAPGAPATLAAAPAGADLAAVPGPAPVADLAASAKIDLASAVVLAAAAAAAGGLLWLLRARLRLGRALRHRRPETDPRVLAIAAEVARELGMRQSPQLSRSAGLGTPIAFGWLRPEICLPPRAGELGDAPLRALLAHEVAHLRAGDPAWMWGAAVLQALFPWQVLLLAVRRRWAHLVELRCDAVAAGHSSTTAVARCLLDVAEWLRAPSGVPAVALGMAARPSALRERIEAVLQGRGPHRARPLPSLLFGALSLSSLTFAAPGVQTAAPAGLPPLPGAPADRPVPPAGRAFALLDDEYAELVAEAAALRQELAGRPRSPELEQLAATLSQRLLVLERLRARLRAALDRSSPEADR